MRKRMARQILAVVLSASLMAGNAMPVFAAEAGIEAETSEDAEAGEYEEEEIADAYPEEDEAYEQISGSDYVSEGEEFGEESEDVTDGSSEEIPDEVPDEYESGSEEEYSDEEQAEIPEENPDIEEEVTDISGMEESSEEDVNPEDEQLSSGAEEEASETEENTEDEPSATLAAASGKAKLADDGEDPPTSGQCGPALNWEIVKDGGAVTLKITGTGAMDQYTSDSPAPWSASVAQLTALEIASGATGIGTNAFAGAAALKNATIPASVTTIPQDAFTGVTGLIVKGAFKSAAETFAKNNKFQFVPMSVTNIAGATITLNPASYVYDGKAKTPAVSVVYSVTPLKAGTDYTVAYSANVNAGSATVTVKGIGNFNGSAVKKFTITPAPIGKTAVSGIPGSAFYEPGGVKPVPKVVFGTVTLKAGKDYVVAYAANTKPGKATVTITGKGNFNGQAVRNFTIVKTPLKNTKIEPLKAMVYTGKALKPNPVITMNGKSLVKGRDYTLKYKNNKNHGTATVTIKGKGSFKGTVKRKFKIQKASVANGIIKGLKDKTYTGSRIKQKLTVKVGKKKLKEGRDYKVSYKNNLSVGIATVTVKGKGDYKGSQKLYFDIERASLYDASVYGLDDQGYTGSAVKPDITVKVNGRTLVRGTDYTLKFDHNVNIGTAHVTIKGIGNYRDSIKRSFVIRRQRLDNAKISVDDQVYTGYDLMPPVKVTLKGKVLKAGRDYSVRYSNNVSIGKATVTVSGMGIYAGGRTASFAIKPRGVRLLSVADWFTYIKVTWDSLRDSRYTYEVECSTDRYFSSDVTRMRVSGTSSQCFISHRSASSNYVRIRVVYTSGGKNYYSEWSTW